MKGEPTHLDRLHLGVRARLYKAMAPHYHPRQVDEMEFWEAAVILGSGEEVPARSGRNLVEERIRAAREGRPPPDIDPTPPEVMTTLRPRT